MPYGAEFHALHEQGVKEAPRVSVAERAAIGVIVGAFVLTAFAMFRIVTAPVPPSPAEVCVAGGGTFTDVGAGLFGPAWECEYPPGVLPVEER